MNYTSLELKPPLNLNSAIYKITINYIWIYNQLQHHSEHQEKQTKRGKAIYGGLRQALGDNLTKLSD